MQEMRIIEVKGTRVLTTRQIAGCYETKVKVINNNFSRNRERYVLGKHYFYFEGEELKALRTNPQFEGELKHATKALFWTEKGALLHAKSLNTDKAWEVYDYLVDFYFRAKEAVELKKEKRQMPVGGNKKKLTEGDVRVLAYNRGIVLGVLRHELEEDSTLEIYERLSAHGKGMVMKLLFGEVCSHV